MRGFVTAMRTLTAVPFPGRDSQRLSDAIPFFPVVGGLIGFLVILVAWWLGGRAGQPGLGALCALGLSVLLTRALHLDGLADVCDALGVQGDCDRRLAVMKDPHVGVFGVVGLVLDVLAKWLAIERLAAAGAWFAILVPFVCSRTVMAQLAVLLPYARKEGGWGRPFVEGTAPWQLGLGLLFAAGLCFAAAEWAGLVLLAGSVAAGALLAVWMRRGFGGVTGDLLGMANEVVETGLLVLAAFSLASRVGRL